MAMEGMASLGTPRKGIIGNPNERSVTLMMPRLGSSSQSQSKPTTTGGRSQGRIISARTNMDSVSRDIMTAIKMARMVCNGMFRST